MSHLHKLSTHDWFSYPEQPILFFYNTDPECKRKYALKVDQPSVVMYTNEANVLEGPDHDLSLNYLLHWINHCITMSKLEWNRRSVGSITQANFNAIVYLNNDVTGDDWAQRIFTKLAKNTKATDGMVLFIAPYSDKSLPEDIPQLSSLMKAKEAECPGIWMYHGRSRQVVKYDFVLREEQLTEELLRIWYVAQSRDIEHGMLKGIIDELRTAKEVEKPKLEYYENLFTRSHKELIEINEEYRIVKEKLGITE